MLQATTEDGPGPCNRSSYTAGVDCTHSPLTSWQRSAVQSCSTTCSTALVVANPPERQDTVH